MYAFLSYTCISLALVIIFSIREETDVGDVDDENNDDSNPKMIKKAIALIVSKINFKIQTFTSRKRQLFNNSNKSRDSGHEFSESYDVYTGVKKMHFP